MAERDSLRERDPTQWALRERVKELTCLYGMAQVADRMDLPFEEAVQRVVELLPPAWQYPSATAARITMDGGVFRSADFREGERRQAADIRVKGRAVGLVEVFCLEPQPDADEGPFLKEERSLIDEVAHQLGLMVERRQAEAESEQLQEQLRRADRLATVGRLAAGVAHELNEPLGAILGYAQLQLKSFGLPDHTGRDLERIVKASLHAREIVRKLLLFARQAPSRKKRVHLDELIKEALYLLETPCKKAQVQMVLRLAKDLPDIEADPGQMQQVILNLGINAVQSMPSGGTLRFVAEPDEAGVLLGVEDTGTGMTREVLGEIFNPFFTTKEVGQGTGLGLSVVHGIVASHGGTIRAESSPGQGTRFEVRLPAAQEGCP
jgi:signal transduction histidine kinase